MADQIDAVVLFVGPGELMFTELTRGVVGKIGQSGEATLSVFALDHTDEVDRRTLFREEGSVFDEASKVFGGFDVNLRSIESN